MIFLWSHLFPLWYFSLMPWNTFLLQFLVFMLLNCLWICILGTAFWWPLQETLVALCLMASANLVVSTVRYRYNTVNFFKNIHERHPIARPLGRGMGCLLLVQSLIDILPQFLQWYMQYVDILDRVITALDCSKSPVWPFPNRVFSGNIKMYICNSSFL